MKKKRSWREEKAHREQAKKDAIARHSPMPESTGHKHPNPKEHPWRMAIGAEEGGLPKTTRWALECGHIVVKGEGKVKRGDDVGCHFCAGATGAFKKSIATKRMNATKDQLDPKQRKRLEAFMRELDQALGAMGDAVIRIKVDMWRAFAGNKRLSPSGDMLLSRNEIAVLCGVHPDTVRTWVKSKRLKRPRRVGQTYYHPLSEIVSLMRKRNREMGLVSARKIRKGHPKSDILDDDMPDQSDEDMRILEELEDESLRRELGGDSSLL